MPKPSEKSENTLVIRKVIPASREEVFAAWTDPESIKDWMCPGEIVRAEAQLDVRVGGAFRVLMKGGAQDFDHTGLYQIIEPPSKLAFTWISAGTNHQSTLVTVELFERGEATELVLTHENLPTADAKKRHEGGWSSIADKLADYFAKRHGPKKGNA